MKADAHAHHVVVNVGADALLGAGIGKPPPSRIVHNRQRRALAISIASGLVLLGIIVAVYFALRAMPGPKSTAFDILVLTVQAFLPAPVAVAFWVHRKLTWTPLTLLWLRKFRESDRDKYRFQFLIKAASGGRLNPITIQDASYRTSFLPGALNPLVTPLLTLFFALGIIVTLAFVMNRQAGKTDVLAVILVWLFLVPALGFFVIRRLGYRSFTDRDGAQKAMLRLSAIKSGKTTLPRQSIDVWKCSNENWQDVVSRVIAASDIVVVDLSEVNENIWWEINTVRAQKKPVNIVWAVENGARADRNLIQDICAEYGLASVDLETLARRGGIFVYPAAPLPGGLPRHYQNQSKGLRALLLARLAEISDQPNAVSVAHADRAIKERRRFVWLAATACVVAAAGVVKMYAPSREPPDEEEMREFLVGRWYGEIRANFTDYEFFADGSYRLTYGWTRGGKPTTEHGRWHLHKIGEGRFRLDYVGSRIPAFLQFIDNNTLDITILGIRVRHRRRTRLVAELDGIRAIASPTR